MIRSYSRSSFLKLAGAGIAGLSLAACNSDNAASTPQASSDGLEKLTFVLDYTPNTNHTGIYVAQEKGFYTNEGIELEIVQPPEDGADALVGTGKAQVGMSYQDVMANYLGSDNPFPVTAVAAIIQHNTSGLISRKGDGIDRPKGLEGKRYGTWDQDVEKAIVRSVVESDGGDWSKVELVPANSTDEVTGLKADQFDAIWCYEAWAGQNAKIQDYPVDYVAFIDIDDTFDYYTPVIIANDSFLAEQPDTVKRFLAATQKGYEYAVQNPDDAAEILVAANPEIDPALAKASQEYLADKYVADASQWGHIDKGRWEKFYQWMNDQQLTPVAIEASSGFTNEYLPEA